MTLYFAYGSNLDGAQMEARCPGHGFRGLARLPGHRLHFPLYSASTWKGAVASLDPCAGSDVWGVLYDLTPAHVAALDCHEGLDRTPPRYRRGELTVVQGEAPVAAFTYLGLPDAVLAEPRPSRRYLDAILAGARARGLPPDYLATLEAIACC